jgi:hypothetical protein
MNAKINCDLFYLRSIDNHTCPWVTKLDNFVNMVRLIAIALDRKWVTYTNWPISYINYTIYVCHWKWCTVLIRVASVTCYLAKCVSCYVLRLLPNVSNINCMDWQQIVWATLNQIFSVPKLANMTFTNQFIVWIMFY